MVQRKKQQYEETIVSIPEKTNTLKIKLDDLKTFRPLTTNQEQFFNLYQKGGYFVGLLGSPGVGKTFLALYKALEEVLDKSNPFTQTVIVRSAVQTRDVGYLPGSLEEKAEIFELPYKEVCQTLFGRDDAYKRLKEQGHIRFITTTAIRGISIDHAVIVVDECQSMTWAELSTIMGRVGHKSKIIFCGDMFQNDLVKSKYDITGLPMFLQVARKMKSWEEVIFTPEDIVRSSLVKEFLVACRNEGLMPNN